MRIRVFTKFTDRVTGNIPYHGTDIIKSASQMNQIIKAHLIAVDENPLLMVTFKLVNIQHETKGNK